MTLRTVVLAAALSLLVAGCSTPRKTPPITAPPPADPPAAAVVKPPPAPPVIRPAPPAPIRRSCVPKGFPRTPAYPDTDAALRDAGGAADRYQLMAAGRVLRALRLAELERVVEGCR